MGGEVEEKVLVIKRTVLGSIGFFHGLVFDVERYLKQFFAPGATCFISRSLVEKDPEFKQIIPYVLLRCDDHYYSYVRGKKSGEDRLKKLRSIGIGGHVNPGDVSEEASDSYGNAYLIGVAREVSEEVVINTTFTTRVVAILNDEANDVGRVHLGIVHCLDLSEPAVISGEKSIISQEKFMSSQELLEDFSNLEGWSKICLRGLIMSKLIDLSPSIVSEEGKKLAKIAGDNKLMEVGLKCMCGATLKDGACPDREKEDHSPSPKI